MASVGRSLVAETVVSPVVHGDGSVTFSFESAKAGKVNMNIEGVGNYDLVKGKNGFWSVTTKPLKPDLYGYSFGVDGVATADPLNPFVKTNLVWPGSLVLVPGGAVWEEKDVPRGVLARHFLSSKVCGDRRDFYVYTPPGYSGGEGDLPVLYLLHGFSDTAAGWTDVGRAHVILDNLIAEKKIRPLVVVMPLGYGLSGFATPGSAVFGRWDKVGENFDLFEKSLKEEVMPVVEQEYRVRKDREGRSIAGLSMGGGESLHVGLRNLDLFGNVGAFSAGGFELDEAVRAYAGVDFGKVNSLGVFYMNCGVDDGLIEFQRGFAKWLGEKGVRVTAKESEGGHEWLRWRRYLVEFLELVAPGTAE